MGVEGGGGGGGGGGGAEKESERELVLLCHDCKISPTQVHSDPKI